MKTAIRSFLLFFILFFLSGKTTNIHYLLIGVTVAIVGGLILFILIAIDCHNRSKPHYMDLGWQNRHKLIRRAH